MTQAMARQKGFALLIVLFALAMLALLGSTVLATARQDAQVARNLREAAVLRAAAHGAVQQAIFRVLDQSTQHWAADDIPRAIRVGAALVIVRVENENDKVNPSIASVPLLRALLLQVGADPVTAGREAEAIAAWPLGGGVPGLPDATAARYVAAGLAFAPPGGPFANLDELSAVMGMTPALLARLRPHLTVFTDSDPDMTTHDPLVARALAAIGDTARGAGPGGPQIVSITADAHGAGGSQFTAREIVRTNARPIGRRFDVLDYEQLWTG
jgi:general secretion pathway protein K